MCIILGIPPVRRHEEESCTAYFDRGVHLVCRGRASIPSVIFPRALLWLLFSAAEQVDRRQAEYYEIARKLQGLGGGKASFAATVGEEEAVSADEVQLPSSAGVDMSSPEVEDVIDENAAGADADTDAVAPVSSEPMTSEAGGSGFSPVEMIQEERIPPAMNPAVTESHGGSPTDTADDEAMVDPATLGPAASSERISEEDLRTVASALVKRLGTGKPLKPEVFEAFSEAVDEILRDTAAST